MAKFERTPNYRAMYPDANDQVIECLEKGHRKEEYAGYDRKVERCVVDYEEETVSFILSREDSLDRLLNEDKQFADASESPEDMAVRTIMIEKMMECVERLSEQERKLITELFFNEKSQHQLAVEWNIPRMTICSRKDKIIAKLKKMMET